MCVTGIYGNVLECKTKYKYIQRVFWGYLFIVSGCRVGENREMVWEKVCNDLKPNVCYFIHFSKMLEQCVLQFWILFTILSSINNNMSDIILELCL